MKLTKSTMIKYTLDGIKHIRALSHLHPYPPPEFPPHKTQSVPIKCEPLIPLPHSPQPGHSVSISVNLTP